MSKRKENKSETRLAISKSHLSDASIQAALEPYGMAVTPRIAHVVRDYVRLLLRWNSSISLTSLTDTEEILGFHFGESLFAASVVPIESGRLADVGSGAGFPGLALKIAKPLIHVILIESSNKKAVFLQEVVRSLGLSDVGVIHGGFGGSGLAEGCLDFVTSRALGKFDEVLPWSRRVLRKSGQLVLWVGEEQAKMVSAHPGFSWRPPVLIPGSKRRFLLIGH